MINVETAGGCYLFFHNIQAVSCAGDFTTVLTSDCLYHCWGSIDLISEEGTATLEWPNPSPFLAYIYIIYYTYRILIYSISAEFTLSIILSISIF